MLTEASGIVNYFTFTCLLICLRGKGECDEQDFIKLNNSQESCISFFLFLYYFTATTAAAKATP